MVEMVTVAVIDVPEDPSNPTKIIEYKGKTLEREFIPGVIEKVVHIHYSDEVYGKIDAIYANGVRFVPEQ